MLGTPPGLWASLTNGTVLARQDIITRRVPVVNLCSMGRFPGEEPSFLPWKKPGLGGCGLPPRPALNPNTPGQPPLL